MNSPYKVTVYDYYTIFATHLDLCGGGTDLIDLANIELDTVDLIDLANIELHYPD